ncbi:MAG: aspartate ammonia-lyase [Alysiella sp.]|uniref:aspartate ammonia-lyase n=1 Tax=Alysiella sp. TaxID=1872483 RepID=UPI0026DCD490|nr:aspartate ammonia-lyase [Alysiella sp.]MDO4434526.1 aspartate ammonia-lyase [Alysiella sp.]
MATRTEYDLLGERNIPNEAYWGIHTLRAVENFHISRETISDFPLFIKGMTEVKKAAAQANGQLGVIKSETAYAIEVACDEILLKNRCLDQFPSDAFQGGAGTSVNMNTNEVIANLALEHLGHAKGSYNIINPMDDVNAGQSTNDAYPTGMRLAFYRASDELLVKLGELQTSLECKANEFKDILKMGRTQLQDAVPMSLGQEFAGFAALLADERAHINHVRQDLLTVNLGATAIGTGVNTAQGYAPLVVEKLSAVTGLPCKLAPNLITATSDCGDYVSLHAALKRTAVKLSKICNDLRLLSSGPRAGLKEINLPEMQAGSSIMPAKVNPVIPEVVNQVCFKVIGNDTAVTFAAEAGQLQLNVMEPVIAQCIFESLRLLANACDNLNQRCIQGITANTETCLNNVLNSIGIVTYLNPIIGHHNGDKVGKICAQTGKNVREVVLELGLMDETQLDKVLSPQNLMNPHLPQ